MRSEKAKDLVLETIQTELNKLEAQQREIASHHEAYALIQDSYEDIKIHFDSLKIAIEIYWKQVRFRELNIQQLDNIEGTVHTLIQKAVELAALVRKVEKDIG